MNEMVAKINSKMNSKDWKSQDLNEMMAGVH